MAIPGEVRGHTRGFLVAVGGEFLLAVDTNEGMTLTNLPRSITGGVDTHLDVHVAAALDERGTLLGVESFATTSPVTRSCWAG